MTVIKNTLYVLIALICIGIIIASYKMSKKVKVGEKMSKYGSKKIVIDGITFDSKDEGKYYLYLKKLKAEEKIINYELQPKYELQPGFKKNGKTYRAITYAPDFLIYHLNGTEELIDVKGMSTQQGEMRKKMFDYKYPNLKLTWVARSLKYGQNGWIEYEKLNKIRRENKKCLK